MAVPKVEVVVTADTRQAEAGLERTEQSLREVGSAAGRAEGRTARLTRGMGGATRGSGGFARAVQNASFQVNDFASQVGAGTRASVALGQQLPQLLQGFGVFGAVISAVVAIGVPLVRVMGDMRTEGESLTQLFGVLEPAARAVSAAFQSMAGVIGSVAETVINNLDRILITGGIVAGFYAGKWVAGMVAARVATLTLAGSMAALRAALIRTGIGAIVIAVGELAFRFLKLSEVAGGTGAAIALIGDVFKEVFGRMRQGVALLEDVFAGIGMIIQGAFMKAFGAVEKGFIGMMNSIIGGLNAVRQAGGMEPFAELQGSGLFDSGEYTMNAGSAVLGSASGSLRDLLSQPLESVQEIRDLLASIKEEGITLPELLAGGTLDDLGGGKKSPVTEAIDEHKKAILDLKRLQGETLSSQLGDWGNYFSSLSTLVGTNNRKLLAISKAFNAAQALINSYVAYTEVLKDPTLPWWARTAAAGSVLAAGLGMVSAINGISASGGGGGGAGAAGGGAAAAAAAPAPLDVRLSGVSPDTLVSGADLGNLLDRLNDEAGDRGFRLMIAT